MTASVDIIRRACPGVDSQVYMDVAARGLIARPVRDAIDSFLDQRMYQGGDKPWMFKQVEETRRLSAMLLGASADEIAVTKNVSEGINAFAASIDWAPGDTVVLCQSLEHPANIFPWRNLERRCGIRIKVVPDQDGRIPVDQLLDSIDSRTRVVTVSSISFSPGFRTSLAEIGEACRKRNVLFLVDAAQSIGIHPIDVRHSKIDALAVSTQKGLMALYGYGFIYVRQDVANSLSPVYLSRMGLRLDDAHEASSGDAADWHFAPAARRFDLGNHNFIGAIALGASIPMLQDVGIGAISDHVCRLSRRLAEDLSEKGLPVFGRPDDPARAHIVCVGAGMSDDHDMTNDRDMIALHDWLRSHGVTFTIRRGLLRFSLHAYNDDSDVDTVSDLVSKWQRAGRPSPD